MVVYLQVKELPSIGFKEMFLSKKNLLIITMFNMLLQLVEDVVSKQEVNDLLYTKNTEQPQKALTKEIEKLLIWFKFS